MEEYIKRKDALDIFNRYIFAGCRVNGKSFFSEIVVPAFYCAIENLPAADVAEVKHGEWEHHSYPDCGIDPEGVFCSICGFYLDRTLFGGFYNYNFCPRCGAEMKGEKNG